MFVTVAAVALLAVAGCSASPTTATTAPLTPDTAPANSQVWAAPATPTFVVAAGPSAKEAAPTPEKAVELFITAEVAGDSRASFALLGAADRAKYVSEAGWQAAHRNLPRLMAFEPVGRGAQGDDNIEIVGTATLVPELSEIKGLVPATATARFSAVAEGGGWRVAATGTRLQPILPDDRRAAAGVQAWLAARRACLTPTGERKGSLVGVVGLADRLCGSTGEASVGKPQPLLDTADLAPFIAAFGPEAGLWARVLAVQSPVPLRAVVAPLGNDWTVVGILAP